MVHGILRPFILEQKSDTSPKKAKFHDIASKVLAAQRKKRNSTRSGQHQPAHVGRQRSRRSPHPTEGDRWSERTTPREDTSYRKPRVVKSKDLTDSALMDDERVHLGEIKADIGRKGKTVLYVSIVYLKIGEVETMRESFGTDVYIQVRWREPYLDGQGKSEELYLYKWKDHWHPKLQLENALPEIKETIWYTVKFDEKKRAQVLEKRRVKGTFWAKMDLRHYPFDAQDLTLMITTERCNDEVLMEEDPNELSTVDVHCFEDEQEWHLHKHVDIKPHVMREEGYKSLRHLHPALIASCKATRKFGFFVWNIILVMFLIGSLAFTTFAITMSETNSRLMLSFTLLLSNITFKFVVNQSVPKIPYLTIMDKYILTSMLILCAVCFWHSMVNTIHNNPHKAHLADKLAFIFFLSTHAGFNVVFMLYVTILHNKRKEHYTKRDLAQRRHQKGISAFTPPQHHKDTNHHWKGHHYDIANMLSRHHIATPSHIGYSTAPMRFRSSPGSLEEQDPYYDYHHRRGSQWFPA